MKKVLLAWYGHESNGFSRNRTSFEILTSQGCWEGDEIIEQFTDTPSYLGGMIKAANESQVTLIPTFAVENAGPILTDECHAKVMSKILPKVEQAKDEIDGICIGLHGAAISESSFDVETEVLKSLRNIVGDDLPITITLDLHGNLSQDMASLTQGVFGIKENPHTDYATTGYEAMLTLVEAIENNRKARTLVKSIPILIPISQNIDGALCDLKNYLKVYKKQHNLLDVAFFHGFPYADSPIVCSSIFVTGYSEDNIESHILFLENYIQGKREELTVLRGRTPEVAIDLASDVLKESTKGFVVINECSDNPGAGAPGDGTQLLEKMIEKNLPGSTFGYIYDPEVAQKAKEAGIGARISVKLGGKIEKPQFHGRPIQIESAEVCSISDGKYIATTPLMKGIEGTYGLTVCLRYKNIDIIISSVQNQTYDDRPFAVGGVDLTQKKLVALKSSQHFKAFYQDKALDIIEVNTNGVSSNDLSTFQYNRIQRPMYPIDNC